MRVRLGTDADIETVPYGKKLSINGVKLSLHPAGHILGSAQVRVEKDGFVAVVSGDYKTEPDATCEAFEPVRCNTFITESTFALPIYRWTPQAKLFEEIDRWRHENIQQGRTSVIFAYGLGKAQRILAGVDPSLTPIVTHESVEKYVRAYRRVGVAMPATFDIEDKIVQANPGKLLVVAPPMSSPNEWLKPLGSIATAFASGWMMTRTGRRRMPIDRGFALSDHADWQGVLDTIDATGADEIFVNHGYTAPLVKWLREHGKHAAVLPTHFEYAKQSKAHEEGEED
jgi:putative mRNA 3-end processing factor